MAHSSDKRPSFPAGLLVMTRRVQSLASQGRLDPTHYVQRHLSGDWGDISQADRDANARAIVGDEPIFSAYEISADLTLWIITAADRSVTILSVPDDYKTRFSTKST